MNRITRLAVLGIGLACAALATPAYAAQWIAGHYGPHGAWHPGHWAGGGPPGGPPPEDVAAPPGYREGRVWVPGHYNGPNWAPGHWAAR